MKKTDILYGLKHQETVYSHIDDVVEDVIEAATEKAGESFDTIADRIEWPIRIHEFRRVDVSHMAIHIADAALEDALGRLDEEHSDPGGDPTEPTPAMVSAAAAFGQAMVAAYVPWACEPNGNVILYTREMAKKECDCNDYELPG